MNLIKLDNREISGESVINVLRKNQALLTNVIRELIIEKELEDIHLESKEEDELIKEFRSSRNIESEESYEIFLQSTQLNSELLLQIVSRPEKVVRYREDRWGPRANSLYLKNKDRYDFATYRRLQSNDADIMQEVYFRLKDKEESWESLARQFSPGDPSANARVGPIEVRQIEPELLEALRAFGVGTVIRPLTIESQVVVAELEVFQASHYNEELKAQILREEFDHWIQEECRTMMNKVNYIP